MYDKFIHYFIHLLYKIMKLFHNFFKFYTFEHRSSISTMSNKQKFFNYQMIKICCDI